MHYLYIYRVLGCDFLSEFSWLWKIFWLQVFLYDCLLCMYTYLLVVIRIWSLFVNWCFDSLHTSNFITFCVSCVPKKNKRSAPTAVVGRPPIRSFRKNLASSSSSKPANESQDVVPNKIASEKPVEVGKKGLFVKINMDGVPIGRKVDLTAYDSYEKLSSAVDELFRGLLAGLLHIIPIFKAIRFNYVLEW